MVVQQLLLAEAASILVAYLLSRKGSVVFKQAGVGAIWMIFLGIPLRSDLSVHRVESMMLASFAVIVSLKLTQMILYPTAYPSKTPDKDLSLLGLVRFTGSVLYYVLPISRAKEPPAWRKAATHVFDYILWAVIKMQLSAFFQLWMRSIAEKRHDESLLTYAELLFLFSNDILAGAWIYDLQCLFIYCISLGRLEVNSFLLYPWLSTSLKDFWGTRYNRLVGSLLKECVYIPAQNYHHYNRRVARYLTFTVSGLMHVYIAGLTFGRGPVRTLAYFLLQAVWMDVEPHLPKRLFGLTHVFFFASCVLYVGLFIEAMPDWLRQNEAKFPLPVDTVALAVTKWLFPNMVVDNESVA